MLKSTARKLYTGLWTALAVLLVLLALYASLGRQYIGLLEQYQQQVFSQLEEYTGLELAAEQLSADWSGLSPVIHFRGLRLGSEQAISVAELTLKIDVVASVISRAPTLKKIRLKNLSVDLKQSDDLSAWYVPGLKSGSGEKGTPGWLIDSLLGVRRASLRDISLKLHYANGVVSSMRAAKFSLEGDGEFRRAYANVVSDGGGEIQLLAEAYGDPRDTADFYAAAYLDVKEAKFSALAPLFRNRAPLIESEVNGKIWLDWRRDNQFVMRGEISAPELAVGALWNKPEDVFSGVAMRFSSSYENQQTSIDFSEFRARWRGQELDFGGMRLGLLGIDQLNFALPALELAAASDVLLASAVLPPSVQKILRDLAPSGTLKSLQLQLLGLASEARTFLLRSELAAVAVEAWQGAPAASGVFGYLEVDGEGGTVILDTADLSLAFPGLYDEAFAFSDFSAELRWLISDEVVDIYSGVIRARDGTTAFSALLDLSLPRSKESEAPPMIMLAIGGRDVDAQLHKKYVPRVLSEGLRDWLASSIEAGHASELGFLYHGSLRASDEGGPSIQLFADFDDVRLAYLAEWPAVEAETASLFIDNNRVFAASKTARLLNNIAIDNLDVAIRPDAKGVSVLSVNAQAAPSFGQARRLFSDTPLVDVVGNVFQDWSGSGRSNVDFSLDFPLVGEASPAIQLRADVNFPRLNIASVQLPLTDVKGELRYSSRDGLSSKNLRSLLFLQPVAAVISQQDKVVNIAAHSRIAAKNIEHWLQLPPLQFFNGSTDVSVNITAGAGDASGLIMRSDMRGIEIALPQPLYKAADLQQPLEIELPFGPDEGNMYIRLADTATMAVAFLDGGMSAAQLVVGVGQVPEFVVGELGVGGRLDFASYDQWQLIAQQMFASKSHNAKKAESLPISIENLNIGELAIFGLILDDVALQAKEGDSAWLLHVDSRQVTGELNVPNLAGETITARLSKLMFPAADKGAESPLLNFDPRSLPGLDLEVASLHMGDEKLGHLGFNLRVDDGGAHFENISGNLRGVQLDIADQPSAQLDWLYAGNGEIQTALRGSFGLADVGELMQRSGYDRPMESRRGNMQIDMQWPGAPDAMLLSNSSGTLQFDLSKGRFLKSSDTASGALRVLSIFNMANVIRRLKLDFRDVFNKGIAFDTMRGDIEIENGQLLLRQPLAVSGPSSRFKMTGSVNLYNDVADLQLTAMLPVGSNIPWVVALLGGIPAAAGAYVVGKIFEEQVDKFSSVVYDISGPIQNPNLELRKVFSVDAKSSGLSENRKSPNKK